MSYHSNSSYYSPGENVNLCRLNYPDVKLHLLIELKSNKCALRISVCMENIEKEEKVNKQLNKPFYYILCVDISVIKP